MEGLVLLRPNRHQPGPDRGILPAWMRILLLMTMFANAIESVFDPW